MKSPSAKYPSFVSACSKIACLFAGYFGLPKVLIYYCAPILLEFGKLCKQKSGCLCEPLAAPTFGVLRPEASALYVRTGKVVLGRGRGRGRAVGSLGTAAVAVAGYSEKREVARMLESLGSPAGAPGSEEMEGGREDT